MIEVRQYLPWKISEARQDGDHQSYDLEWAGNDLMAFLLSWTSTRQSDL